MKKLEDKELDVLLGDNPSKISRYGLNWGMNNILEHVSKLEAEIVKRDNQIAALTVDMNFKGYKKALVSGLEIEFIRKDSYYRNESQKHSFFSFGSYEGCIRQWFEQIKPDLELPSLEKLDHYAKTLGEIKPQDLERAKENAEALAFNRKIENTAIAFLEKCGVPKTVPDPKSRKYIKDHMENPAYTALRAALSKKINSISENGDRICSVEEVESKYKLALYVVECMRNCVIKKENGKKEELARRERDAAKASLLMRLAIKYEIDTTKGVPTKEDVTDVLLAKNKYLRLGHYLRMNRSDWNDGPSYAKIGLRGFECENALDKAIHEIISDLVFDWGGDGRVFRDCEYSYEYLFSLASEQNEELYNDYNSLNEYS